MFDILGIGIFLYFVICDLSFPQLWEKRFNLFEIYALISAPIFINTVVHPFRTVTTLLWLARKLQAPSVLLDARE